MGGEVIAKLDQEAINLLVSSASSAIASQVMVLLMLFEAEQGQQIIQNIVRNVIMMHVAPETEAKEPNAVGSCAVN
jgi:hypothetical protein